MKALILAVLLTVPASAETVAVLSSDSKPYREALEGLRLALGPKNALTIAPLEEDAPADTVVAFGAKAALVKHENASVVIVALAPAYIPTGNESACVFMISIMPAPEAMIASLLRIKPGLTRIWVPWLSDAFSPYMKDLAKAGRASGVEVEAVKLSKIADLPERLRAADSGLVAILIPPDPELVSRSSFEALKQAALAKKAPLIAPFSNLVSEGATASIGASFREMGRLAGAIALKPKNFGRCERTQYPERLEMRVSLSAARAAGFSGDPAFYAEFAETVP